MKMLVTGGAGFIGSHIVDALIERGNEVVVLDDLNTGYQANVPPGVELIIGSIADDPVVREAVRNCEVVVHVAAHKAVLRSVELPLETDTANTHGTLTVLKAALDAGVRRVVYASSSSVYGGATHVPTDESEPLMPRSPYAVTKLAGEHYCRVFTELYGLETVTLRYFNVFGPRQRPDATYAAVIPLFIDALFEGQPVTVHGDGEQRRDFTYVADVVAANLAAVDAAGDRCAGRAYNIAAGNSWSLLDLIEVLGRILDVRPVLSYGPSRPGDVHASQAAVSAAARDLEFVARVDFETGLRHTVDWFRERRSRRDDAITTVADVPPTG